MRINDEEGDGGDAIDDQDDDVQVGGMESRIAYLNALSHRDISASSSSGDNNDDDSDKGESDAEYGSVNGESIIVVYLSLL